MSFILLLSISFVVLTAHSTFAEFFNKIHPNRTLIVLSAPSVWDDSYREDFDTLIAFQIEFARTIRGYVLDIRSPRLPKNSVMAYQQCPTVKNADTLNEDFSNTFKTCWRGNDSFELHILWIVEY
ncbi:hypothetical protein Tcan_02642 [Toxocara canis]|uniref:Uncharacterized protein n=1 Tax=Toxocara canis TaxID=6265 RepID=A0A0B2V350_TOXCA|nr:hypothetical protein Tcan_02642 [Toxocara canis]